MEENSVSDNNVDYWDGYDSDKDGEYVPESDEEPPKVVTLKIRGKIISLPPLESGLRSTSKDMKLTLNNNKRVRLMKANNAGSGKPSKQDKLEETPSTSMNLDRANVADDHRIVHAEISKLAINRFDGGQEGALTETAKSDEVGEQNREWQDVLASSKEKDENMKVDQLNDGKSIEIVEGENETPLTEGAKQKEKRLSRKRSRNPENGCVMYAKKNLIEA